MNGLPNLVETTTSDFYRFNAPTRTHPLRSRIDAKVQEEGLRGSRFRELKQTSLRETWFRKSVDRSGPAA